MGLQIQVLSASTRSEIEAAFATLVRDRADALFVAPELGSSPAACPICDARGAPRDSRGLYQP